MVIYGAIAVSALIVGIGLVQFTPALSRMLSSCSVKRINLYGPITTYPQVNADGSQDGASSDEVMNELAGAMGDPSIKGVILDIDSPGGSMVAGEEIATALQELGKPSVALVRDQAASAAYRAAIGADAIVASENSNVGSIGVIYSYLEDSVKNAKDGLAYVEISSGKYKSLGNPDMPLTADERALIQRDVDIMHANFIHAVAARRNISESSVAKLADGSTVLGQASKDAGLIDELGGLQEALNAIADMTGENERLCEY